MLWCTVQFESIHSSPVPSNGACSISFSHPLSSNLPKQLSQSSIQIVSGSKRSIQSKSNWNLEGGQSFTRAPILSLISPAPHLALIRSSRTFSSPQQQCPVIEGLLVWVVVRTSDVCGSPAEKRALSYVLREVRPWLARSTKQRATMTLIRFAVTWADSFSWTHNYSSSQKWISILHKTMAVALWPVLCHPKP